MERLGRVYEIVTRVEGQIADPAPPGRHAGFEAARFDQRQHNPGLRSLGEANRTREVLLEVLLG